MQIRPGAEDLRSERMGNRDDGDVGLF